LNISKAGSDLRVQIQTDTRYFDFPDRAMLRNILGLELPVATMAYKGELRFQRACRGTCASCVAEDLL
jgi:hypothetical protein